MTLKQNKIPTFVGLAILLLTTFVGVFFINSKQIFKIGAKGESVPKDIRVSNITDSSLTISWTTDKESVGFLVWDKGPTLADEKSFTHSITLSGLESGKTYSYKINSDGNNFDNNGIPWQAKTLISPLPSFQPVVISGSVLSATGEPVKKALVYLNVGGTLFSTITSDSGNYVIQVPQADPENTLLEIFIQAGPNGNASAKIYPKSAQPVPPIILGNTHDFRNLPPSAQGEIPNASLNLPENITKESKFNIPETTTSPSSASVTLDSLKDGEIITSTQPEFFGKGPAGEIITIKVESENPIIETTNINQTGSWNWSPSQNLAPGSHQITLTWKDFSGVTRSLTRSFIVQAGESPAFEASGSAETSTPSPQATATPLKTISPSNSPSPAPSSPLPETGSLTPTLIFSMLGISILFLGFAFWQFAQNKS